MVEKLHIAALNISQVSFVFQAAAWVMPAFLLQRISTTHSLTAEPLWIAGGKARCTMIRGGLWILRRALAGQMSQCCFMADALALVTNVGDELGLYEVRVHLGEGDGMRGKASYANRQIWHYRNALCVFFFIWRCLPKLLLPGYPSLRFAQIIIYIFAESFYLSVTYIPKYQLYTGNAPKKEKIDCGTDWVEVLSEENLTGVFFQEWHECKKRSAKFSAIVMYCLEVSLTQHLAAVFHPLQATSNKTS